MLTATKTSLHWSHSHKSIQHALPYTLTSLSTPATSRTPIHPTTPSKTMNAQLKSDNILLLFGDPFQYATMHDLWQTFRRTAVEPGQSPFPDLTAFSDDCLLCARIVRNAPHLTPHENNYASDNDSLWDPEPVNDSPSSTATVAPPSLTESDTTVGLIYLHGGFAIYPAGEANIGVIIKPDMQRRGYAREAVQLLTRWAFEELKFHRVQAAVLDTPFKDRALRLFIGAGFVHEGTKRRAVYQPEGEGMAGVWKDVTYLAMLDTEWVLKSTWIRSNNATHAPVISVWDEMFARHAREREELVRWEEKQGRVRKSASTETLREYKQNAAQNMGYLTDDASSFGGSMPPSPRLNIVVNLDDDTDMSDDLDPDEVHERWEDVVGSSIAARRRRQWMEDASLHPSLQGHMLALPSIRSGLSDENSQSPLTIPSPSTPGSTPPFSPSPSPEPSSVHSTWSSAEDEDNWLPRPEPTPTHVPGAFTAPSDPYPHTGSASVRSLSRSSSMSSVDSWSDAQSSVGGSSSSWDVLSNASDDSLCLRT